MRNWIHDNLCYLTIKSDTGQHSQFLRCFISMSSLKSLWYEIFRCLGWWKLNFCLESTLGMCFWVWLDLWRLIWETVSNCSILLEASYLHSCFITMNWNLSQDLWINIFLKFPTFAFLPFFCKFFRKFAISMNINKYGSTARQ